MLPTRMLQFKLKSNVGLIIHHARRELHEQRKIKKVVRRLKKFKPEKIDKLNKKYLKKKKPKVEKFNVEIGKLVDEFLVDYLKYREYFKDIIELFNEANVASQRQEVTTIQQAESIMNDITKNIWKQRFTKKSKAQFIKEHLRYMDRIRKMIKKSKKSDLRIIHKRTPKVKFFRKLFPERKLAREERKKAMEVGSDYLKMKNSEVRIEEELKNGIRQDFLLLLLRYIKDLERADIDIEIIQEDIKLLVNKQAQEYKKETEYLLPFLDLVKNNPELKNEKINPQTIQKDIKELTNSINNFAKTDWKDLIYIKRLLNLLERRGKVLESTIQVVK